MLLTPCLFVPLSPSSPFSLSPFSIHSLFPLLLLIHDNYETFQLEFESSRVTLNTLARSASSRCGSGVGRRGNVGVCMNMPPAVCLVLSDRYSTAAAGAACAAGAVKKFLLSN